jgi:hypothetical protein
MVLKGGIGRPSGESLGLPEDLLGGVELVLVLERRRKPKEYDHERASRVVEVSIDASTLLEPALRFLRVQQLARDAA